MTPKSSVFAVYDQPYCLWELESPKRNIDFLKAVDAGYFSYVVEQNVDQLDSEKDGLRAAMAIRLAYYQSAEMLFSYLSALIQAPDCVYAWLEKCSTPQLRSVVDAISTGRGLSYHKTNFNEFSWLIIANGIFAYASQDIGKCGRLGADFGKAWARFALEFLDPNNIAEYNALKHGNRASPGGFTLRVGLENEYGRHAPTEAMKVMTHSKWGGTFFRLERFGGSAASNRSLRSCRHSLNWNVWNTAAATQLMSASINNVISAILILNGEKPSSAKFVLPEQDGFESPWAESIGLMNHATFDLFVNDDPRYSTTKEDIIGVFDDLERDRADRS